MRTGESAISYDEMRPVGSSDPLDSPIRCWTSSAIVGLAFGVVAMSYSLFVDAWIRHGHFWMVPSDLWMAVDAGRFVWHGALGYVYQGTSSYSLPLSFIVMAPVSGLIDHFGLVEGSPQPVPHPNAWLLVGPYSLLFAVVFLHAARSLASELGVRRRLWLSQVLASVVVLVPAYYWGHFEDALALAFILYALRNILRRNFVRAAFVLSVAISFKQTGLALLPLLVCMAPRESRVRCLAAACALPAVLAGFALSVDWADASKALLSPVNLVSGYEGHSAVYITWLGAKTSEVSRAAGLLLSVLAGWYFRRAKGGPEVLAAAGLIMLIRPFSEAINYSYYWAPGLFLLACVGVANRRQIRWRDWVWPMLAIIWTMPRSNGTTSLWWWAGELITVGATVVQAGINCGYLHRWPGVSRLSVKKAINEPILMSMTTAQGAGETTWIQ